nr:Arm DNA-binding domain-containing protein [uncultured Achromobacter sp.]
MPLTDLAVRNAKSGPRLQKLSDGRGLQLHISPTGSTLWRWAYRFDGKQKLMALDVYPDISLAQAHQAVDAARKH